MRFASTCKLVATIQSALQDRTTQARDSAREKADDLKALVGFFTTNTVVVQTVEIHAPESLEAARLPHALLQDFADHLAAQEAGTPKGVLGQFGAARALASYTDQLDRAFIVLFDILLSLFAQLIKQSGHELQQLDDFAKAAISWGESSDRRQVVTTTLEQLRQLDPSTPSYDNLWKLIAVCEAIQELWFVASSPQAETLDLKKCWASIRVKVAARKKKVAAARLVIDEYNAAFWGEIPDQLQAAAILVVQTAATFRKQLDDKRWADAEITYWQADDAIWRLDSVLKVIKVRSGNALTPQKTAGPQVRQPAPQSLPRTPKPVAQPRHKERPSSPAKPVARKSPLPVTVDTATMDRMQTLSHRVNKIVRAFDSRGWGAVDDAKDFVADCKQQVQNNTGSITSGQIACQLDHIETWCASLEAALAEDSVALAEQVGSIAIADGFQ